MVVTGGVVDHKEEETTKFHVWLLNLTHADIFGEEDWFHLESYDATEECPKFVYNGTNDPWNREDLWQHSVQCAP